jgi:signal peptidase I
LQIKDRVAVNKVPFLSHNISRGDIVVFRDPAGWLPEITDTPTNKYVAKLKTGLVDIGVLPNPAKQYLVKRVIGVAGDHVVCCNKKGLITVNGAATTEPYIFAGNKPSDMKFNVKVPEGKIWVLGDHREASADSRYHRDDVNKGFVPLSRVTGRVIAVIWPFKNITYIPKIDVLN